MRRGDSWSFLRWLRGIESEQVARLAFQCNADRLERGEADRLRLAGFQDRQVREGDVDARGEFRERHAARVQRFVETDDDRHVTPFLRGPRACVRPARTRPPARTASAPRTRTLSRILRYAPPPTPRTRSPRRSAAALRARARSMRSPSGVARSRG